MHPIANVGGHARNARARTTPQQTQTPRYAQTTCVHTSPSHIQEHRTHLNIPKGFIRAWGGHLLPYKTDACDFGHRGKATRVQHIYMCGDTQIMCACRASRRTGNGQRATGKGQRATGTADARPKPTTADQRPETTDQRPETGDRRPETRRPTRDQTTDIPASALITAGMALLWFRGARNHRRQLLGRNRGS